MYKENPCRFKLRAGRHVQYPSRRDEVEKMARRARSGFKKVFAELPPKVEYFLTDIGKTALPEY